MSIPDTVGGHDITKGNAHFLSSLKYRGQLYSKVYGQATPSTIGQMTSALTIGRKYVIPKLFVREYLYPGSLERAVGTESYNGK